MSTRKLTNWIQGFEKLMEPTGAPQQFITWGAISAISSVLGRRSYIQIKHHACFPNQFIMMVSPPGVGKSSVIGEIKKMVRQIKIVNLAPDKTTRAALEDFTQAICVNANKYELDPVSEMHGPTTSIVIINDELGVLMSEYSTDLSTLFTKFWDCEGTYASAIRTNGVNIDLENLCMSMLVGAQPKLMEHVLPETSQGQGFMTRVLMIYADKGRAVDLWDEIPINGEVRQQLMADLHQISRMRGKFHIPKETREIGYQWETAPNGPFPPIPTHAKLQDYNNRRFQHALKLAMVFSAARDSEMVILPSDLINAIEHLVDAEAHMPNIFAEMGAKGYGNAIEDLFMAMVEMQRKNGGKPIHEAVLRKFLVDRMPTNQIEYALQQMLKMDMIEYAGTHKALEGMAEFRPIQSAHNANMNLALVGDTNNE